MYFIFFWDRISRAKICEHDRTYVFLIDCNIYIRNSRSRVACDLKFKLNITCVSHLRSVN